MEVVIQTGHMQSVLDLCFSSDGKRIATCGDDEVIKLWDLQTGHEYRALVGHFSTIHHIQFSPDNRFLASSSNDGTIRLWDTTSGEEIRKLYEGEDIMVKPIQFDQRGRYLAAKVQEKRKTRILVWEMPSGKLRKSMSLSFENDGFAFSPDGNLIAVYDLTKQEVKVFKVRRGRLWKAFPLNVVESRYVYSDDTFKSKYVDAHLESDGVDRMLKHFDDIVLSFSENADLLAIAHKDNPLQFIKLLSPKVKVDFPSERMYRKVAFRNDNRLLAYNLNGIEVWNVSPFSLERTISPALLHISPDLKWLAKIKGRQVEILDALSGKKIRSLGQKFSYPASFANAVNHFPLASNSVYPMIATGTPDGVIHIWDFRKRLCPFTIPAHSGRIAALAFDPFGKLLVSGAVSESKALSEIKVFNLKNFQETWSFSVEDGLYEIIFSPIGGSIAIAGLMNLHVANLHKQTIVSFGNTASEESQGSIEGTFPKIAFDPTGQSIIVAVNAEYRRWSLEGEILEAHEEVFPFGSVAAIGTNEKGQIAIGLSQYKAFYTMGFSNFGIKKLEGHSAVAIWNLYTAGDFRPITFPAFFIRSLAFHPDKDLIAVGCGDGMVHLLDTNHSDTSSLKTWRAHNTEIAGIAFIYGARHLVTVGLDSVIKLWDTQNWQLSATLFSSKENDFVMVSSKGEYRATKEGLKKVIFLIGEDTMNFEQFDLLLNRPDRLLESLGYAPPEMINVYHRMYLNRLKKVGLMEHHLNVDLSSLPRLVVENNDLSLVSEERTLTLMLKGISNNGIRSLKAEVNDVPINVETCILAQDVLQNAVRYHLSIPLSAGDNYIQLAVQDKLGYESLKKNLKVTCLDSGSGSELYVLAIGVNKYLEEGLNLNYAAKDARDIVKNLQHYNRNFKEIHVKLLLDQAATKDNILEAASFFDMASRDDQAVLFLAGHGTLDGADYYFLPHDYQRESIASTCLHYDHIEALLQKTPARRRLILLDTCHAGEADDILFTNGQGEKATLVPGLKTRSFRDVIPLLKHKRPPNPISNAEILSELFTNIHRHSGAFVIGASGASEYAIEQSEYKNGVFTYCILETIKEYYNKAEQELYVGNLHQIISQKVTKITNGAQRPVSRQENLTFDFLFL